MKSFMIKDILGLDDDGNIPPSTPPSLPISPFVPTGNLNVQIQFQPTPPNINLIPPIHNQLPELNTEPSSPVQHDLEYYFKKCAVIGLPAKFSENLSKKFGKAPSTICKQFRAYRKKANYPKTPKLSLDKRRRIVEALWKYPSETMQFIADYLEMDKKVVEAWKEVFEVINEEA